jgi:signal transduction histidine kinase
MSFTGRIRLFLVGIALLPPLLMMVVVYFYSVNQAEISYREYAAEDLRKLAEFRQQFRSRLATSLKRIVDHSWFDRSVRLAERGRSSQISFDDLQGFGLNFYELLDPIGRVVGSSHRPGLIGEMVSHESSQMIDGISLYETVEYDIDGHHAALAGIAGDAESFRIYGGFYLGSSFKPTADQIMRGQLLIHFIEKNNINGPRYASMDFGSLYRYNDRLEAVLFGGEGSGFVTVADFEPPDQSAVFSSFIDVISLVALVAVLAAVALGMYVSHRARKEFDNLIDAFGRVAAGDLSTAVMAYTEGEFSNLADSFSEMTQKLRRSQDQLATTEKIAAWQAMARKIAHEIKNPLTPIGISAEDLRRSYQEHLPEFEQTLDQNTRMIKSEINRLTRLLDEFVSFARMKPPEITEVRFEAICAELESLYGEAAASNRLTISNRTARATVRLDPELIKQLLVNLVKNGLESKDGAMVSLSFDDDAAAVKMTGIDDGPGFSDEVLKRRFEPYLSTKKDGSGLGLVICQRIVHDHGGSIELKNRTEGGAEVTIVLPAD